MKNENNSFKSTNLIDIKVNPGSTSILLIFVTLCLVAFAVLCIVSANSDKKLGNKVIEKTTEYYQACNKAQEVISQIDHDLYTCYINSKDKNEYYSQVGFSRSFAINISSGNSLHISLDILYPETSSDCFYRITNWQLE